MKSQAQEQAEKVEDQLSPPNERERGKKPEHKCTVSSFLFGIQKLVTRLAVPKEPRHSGFFKGYVTTVKWKKAMK